MASIAVKASRFALLKIEDDDDVPNEPKQNTKSAQQSKNSQKKAKKKKKADADQSGVGDWAVQSGGKSRYKNKENATEAQWEEWQKVDKEFTAETFEKDLQQALLLSKLEHEETKEDKKKHQHQQQHQQEQQNKGDPQANSGETKEGKKKKKKDKPNTMSLEEFNQKDQPKLAGGDLDSDFLPPSLQGSRSTAHSATSNSQEEDQFFDSLESDVNRILRKEKMQEEYKKQYAVENVMSAKYREEISKRDKEIEFLKATMKKQEDELKQVKKRNKQLCVILAQGEMKDKAEILVQVDQLTQIKDELTEQVQEITGEVEKERSKNHSLKAELDKLKGGKHGGK